MGSRTVPLRWSLATKLPSFCKWAQIRRQTHPVPHVSCPAASRRASTAPPTPAVSLIPQMASVDKDTLKKLKVVELQAELAILGRPRSGRKEDLVERLLAAIAEHKHQPQPPLQAQHGWSLPDDTQAAQVHEGGDASDNGNPISATAVARDAVAPPNVITSTSAQLGSVVPLTNTALPPTEDSSNSFSSDDMFVSHHTPAEAKLADTSSLPPFPQVHRGAAHDITSLQLTRASLQRVLATNPTDLLLAFLGTGNMGDGRQARSGYSSPSAALLRGKDAWLFDCGEDTQRAVAEHPHVKPSKLYRVFLTSLSAESVLGLPGLLCTISASREQGHENADIPVHIYGPPGLTEYLATILKVSHTYMTINIIVHEFLLTAHASSSQAEPELTNHRARIFSVEVPPDQLNPKGIVDGSLDLFMPSQGRATKSKGSMASGGVLAFDPRAGYLPFDEPPRGDPRRPDVAPTSMTWTIQIDISARVTAILIDPQRLVLGYVVQEAGRCGNLCVERTDLLKLARGVDKAKLKEGKQVINKDGMIVTPEMAVTPPKPGRKLVFLGSCASPRASEPLWQLGRGCDVLVHGLVRDPGSQPHRGVLMPSACEAGRLAEELDAQLLVLGRFDASSPPTSAIGPSPVDAHFATALASAPGRTVTAAYDGLVLILGKHDGVTSQSREASLQVLKEVAERASREGEHIHIPNSSWARGAGGRPGGRPGGRRGGRGGGQGGGRGEGRGDSRGGFFERH